jgi:hypothetical protein
MGRLQQQRFQAAASGDFAAADAYNQQIAQYNNTPTASAQAAPIISGADAWTTVPWDIFAQ